MKLKENQFRRIEKLLPKQRGNVKIDNRVFLDAIIYRCKNGCSWRDLPKDFGNWHVIYMRFSRWTQNGVFDRVHAALSEDGLQNATEYGLDSTSAKVHPDAFGCLKKTASRQ
jgi:transposase